jgi:hypothetical protein
VKRSLRPRYFWFSQDGDDIVGSGAGAWRADDGEEHLDDGRIVLFIDDDRVRGLQAEQPKVVQIERTAVSRYDARRFASAIR